MNKVNCLNQAVEITKLYAANDSPKDYEAVTDMLENVYAKLKELYQDAHN